MLTTHDTWTATLAVVISITLWTFTQAFNCKFPNEGCDSDDECCSGKCVDAHPGTNARCTKLSIDKPCLYTYQCEDRLRCGDQNKCCAKYWGVCSHRKDCCDPDHYCYEVDGFYYKRCLYENNIKNKLSPPPWASPCLLAGSFAFLGFVQKWIWR